MSTKKLIDEFFRTLIEAKPDDYELTDSELDFLDLFYALLAEKQFSYFFRDTEDKVYFKKKLLSTDIRKIKSLCCYLLFCVIVAYVFGDREGYGYFRKIPGNEKNNTIMVTQNLLGFSYGKKKLELKALNKLSLFIKQCYSPLSIEYKLRGKNGDFFLWLLEDDAYQLMEISPQKMQYIPLSFSCIDFVEHRKEVVSYLLRSLPDPKAEVTPALPRMTYFDYITIILSWMDRPHLQFDTSNVKNPSNPTDYTKPFNNFYTLINKVSHLRPKALRNLHEFRDFLGWYLVAVYIAGFNDGTKFTGHIPDIPEVKKIFRPLEAPQPHPNSLKLDLKKKDKYMKMLGFAPVPVPFVEHKEGSKVQLRLNIFADGIIEEYLRKYGPLHVQTGRDQWHALTAYRGLSNGSIYVGIDGRNPIETRRSNFLLYYPKFLAPEVQKLYANYEKDYKWDNTWRNMKRKVMGRKPIPMPKPSAPSPYFYSPIYYYARSWV